MVIRKWMQYCNTTLIVLWMYTVNVYCEHGVLRKVSKSTLSVLFIPCDGSILHLSTYISPTYIGNTLWAAGIVSVTTLPAVNDIFTPRVNTNLPQLRVPIIWFHCMPPHDLKILSQSINTLTMYTGSILCATGVVLVTTLPDCIRMWTICSHLGQSKCAPHSLRLYG